MIWKYILYAILGVIAIYVLLMIFTPYIFISSKKEYEKNSGYFRWLLESSTAIMMFICNIGVKVTGKEKVPKDSRFVIVCNHRSNYDPIVTWHVLRGYKIAYVSKAGNFKIPMWGRIIRKCCFMAIDREDPRKAMVTINKAAKLIQEDEVSIGIYPEGTRSKNCVLLPFRAGALKIAQKARVPIVVATIEGTETIHKRVPFRRSHVNLKFCEVLPVEKVTSMKSTELSSEIREIMENNLSVCR